MWIQGADLIFYSSFRSSHARGHRSDGWRVESVRNILLSILNSYFILILKQYYFRTTEPYFYTTTVRINRIVPLALRACLEDHEYVVAAIWNTSAFTEIYILNYDADSDEVATLESLSQSFICS